MAKFIIVFITAGNIQEARKIAGELIISHLAACVNIIPKVESIFWWEGKVDKSDEVLLIVKTRKALFNKLAMKVKSLHSYEVPEIIAAPVVCGDSSYLSWLSDSLL
ncbi:MAG: divalent-cation tolerance protein CutA [Candidatus Omnitrophica bacterium]|nr:divalent-cation tolerance protein CutA [Candidatus Omnitrophota bacterium]